MLLTQDMIRKVCPRASADFVMKHLEASHKIMNYSLLDVQADLDQGGAGAAAEEVWHDLVAKYVTQGMTKEKAIRTVANDHPAINMAYVQAHNQKHGGKMRDVAELKEAHLQGVRR